VRLLITLNRYHPLNEAHARQGRFFLPEDGQKVINRSVDHLIFMARNLCKGIINTAFPLFMRAIVITLATLFKSN